MEVINEYRSVYWNKSVLPSETILEGGKSERRKMKKKVFVLFDRS